MPARQPRGVYIVIEGPPGSGKTAVTRLVCNWLAQQRIPTYTGYDSPPEQTGPAAYPIAPVRTELYTSNTARLRQQDLLRDALEHGMVCVIDGNYLSGFAAHYYGRGDVQDYAALNELCLKADGSLRPDLTIVLQAPAAILAERLAARTDDDRSYHPGTDYLERVVIGYAWEAKQRQFTSVDAGLDLAAVMSTVQQLIAPLLQDVPKNGGAAAPPETAPHNNAADSQPGATPISKLLAARTSQPSAAAGVSASGENSSAAMPAIDVSNASALLVLAVTEVVAEADRTLTPGLSAGAGGETQEKYRYYTPITLGGTVKTAYTKAMAALSNIHRDMANRLTEHIQKTVPDTTGEASRVQALGYLRAICPIAAASALSLRPASPDQAERYAAALCASDLIELQSLGHELLQYIPPEQAEAVTRQSASILEASSRVNRLTAEATDTTYALPPAHNVKLVSYMPRNEADAIYDSLYEHSDLEYPAVKSTGEKLSYEMKMELLGALKRQAGLDGGGMRSSLASVSYVFDAAASFGDFLELRRQAPKGVRMTLQPLTPRFGYKTPDIIEEAGLTEYYDKCFDLSLQLHSALQAASHMQEALYAVLHGHIVRFKIDIGYRDMAILSGQAENKAAQAIGTQLKDLADAMRGECQVVHPALWTD